MSLIAEALRKAHLESKQREAVREGGAPYVPGAGIAARPGADPGRSRARWIAALVGSNLLLAAGAFGFYHAVRAPEEPTPGHATASAAPAEATTPPAAERPREEPAAVEEPSAPAAAEKAEAAPPAEPAGPSPAASAAAAPATGPPSRATSTPERTPAVSNPDPAPAERAPARYTYGFTLLDGRRIQLNGVVGSAGGHRAMINDRLLGVGDGVEGFEIVRIDRRGVALRSGDRSVYIELP